VVINEGTPVPAHTRSRCANIIYVISDNTRKIQLIYRFSN